MLTPEEELRLTEFIHTDDSSLFKGLQFNTAYYINESKWLAEKLKEVNEELKVIKHLYQGINPKDIDQVEKDYNQMIQDVKDVHNTTLIKKEVKDCNCTGISHVNSCPWWVLPY